MAFTNLQSRLKNSPARIYDVCLMPDQIADLFVSASVKRIQLSENEIQALASYVSGLQ